MIVGRNPRNAVIGDTALLRADNRRGVGTIVESPDIPGRFKDAGKIDKSALIV
jgi:hypothetical protein